MATKFLERYDDGDTVVDALSNDAAGNVAPIVVDDEDERIKYYDRTNDRVLTVQTGMGMGEVLTAARTLTAADSGKIFFLAAAGGFQVSLPAVATALKGWHATFLVQIAPTTAYTIVSAAQDLAGLVFENTGGDADEENAFTATTVTFVANTSLIGEKVEIYCDGTGFYALCFAKAAGGITITG
jgi:hypothetical protein